jgi:signal transduction histidine kinase/CheY-like chemotaxis protein
MSKGQINFLNDHEESRRTPAYIYILIAATTLIITVTISYSLYLGNRSANYYSPLIDAAHEIKISSALAHLWVEEALADDPDIRIEDVMTHYDRTYGYITAMLEGDKIHKKTVTAVDDMELRKTLKLAQEKITYSRKMTENRFALQHEAIVGADIDQEFDRAFVALLETATKIENRLITIMDRDMKLFRSIQWGLILSSFLISFVASMVIFKFNRNRNGYILEIQDKNRQLIDMNLKLATTEQQLRASNQQLMASEQQLKASNQQLLANEQQLKAANQQLLANEQQLKALNQQLMASEQQLKASNQQLLANEQQLSAANQQLLASEKALRESENRYRSLFTDMAEGVALHRVIYNEKNSPVNYEIIHVNPQYENILDIPREQVVGKLATEAYGVPEPPYLSEYADVAENGNPYRFERFLPSMNKYVDISVSSFEKGYFATIFSDITWRKKVDEERIQLQTQMQKLESVGILAGGIAHDFNNLLAGIRNNVYLSMMHVDRENNVYENLKSAEKAIDRASNLTQQLLTFSRGGTPVKKTASIVDLIKESAEFVLRGSNVNCEYDMADNIWPAEVDQGQVNQVIHNLILNAVQSMPGGGTIRISTENIEPVPGTGLPLQEGRYIKIVMQDRGVGIAEEQLHKIFDPFYTTKEMGRGLGLSITYSIIKNHDGHISVESEPGAGTTFTIYLPASEKQPEEKETVEDTFTTGEGKILIMDDEEIIRESVEQLLTLKGYEVECAKDGDEAIELYKKAMKASKPFNAVILDLTIRGGMGGKEAVKKLREIAPDVKAIVASGYSNDPVLANYREYGFCGVFAKHDKTEELGKTLHQVINGYQ